MEEGAVLRSEESSGPLRPASSSTAPRSGLSPLPATRPIWEHYGHLWKANDRLLCLACFIIAPLTVSVHPSCMLHSAAGRLEHPWKKKISQARWIYYAPYRKMLNYSVWYEIWREQGGYQELHRIFKGIVHPKVLILSSLIYPCVVSYLVRLRFEVSKICFFKKFIILFSKDALNFMHWLSIHLRILGGQCITISKKLLSSTAVFNIDNNKKCFLSTKSAY